MHIFVALGISITTMVILMLLTTIVIMVITVKKIKKKLEINERNRASEPSVIYAELEHVDKMPPGAIDTESNMAYTTT